MAWRRAILRQDFSRAWSATRRGQSSPTFARHENARASRKFDIVPKRRRGDASVQWEFALLHAFVRAPSPYRYTTLAIYYRVTRTWRRSRRSVLFRSVLDRAHTQSNAARRGCCRNFRWIGIPSWRHRRRLVKAEAAGRGRGRENQDLLSGPCFNRDVAQPRCSTQRRSLDSPSRAFIGSISICKLDIFESDKLFIFWSMIHISLLLKIENVSKLSTLICIIVIRLYVRSLHLKFSIVDWI